MATPEVSEPPRPRVVVFPLASKPWKPATTITLLHLGHWS